MSHTGIEDSEVQAQFYFVCVNPTTLTREKAQQYIAEIFDVSGASNPENEDYVNYCAFVQDDGTALDASKPLLSMRYALPGEHFRVPTTLTSGVLDIKYEDEKQKNRVPGHKSTVAPSFLKEKTLAMIIGSRPYLALNAELYMERYGLLRADLLVMIRQICALEPRRGGKNATYVHCKVKDKKFYHGNFDALLEAVRRTKMSTRDMLERLDEMDTH